MKVTISIDSFKGSLSSVMAGEAVREAVNTVFPGAKTHIVPLADGGEGTLDAIISATDGRRIRTSVLDPLGRDIDAEYGVINGNTADIEMATASGITLLSDAERNPMKTTTYGVGQLIRHAIDTGCRKFIIGIGGSATNDGGCGMLSALGFELLDSEGKEIPLGAEGLANLSKIKTETALGALCECEFLVACDVKNPLCGKQGCSAVYGPQKGASDKDIILMDGWLRNYARLAEGVLLKDYSQAEGAGAAGGLGFALIAFLGAELLPGIELIADTVGLEEEIRESDLVITGEGRLDGQTGMGKAPVGVAKIAKKYGKPVLAFSGAVSEDATALNGCGIDAFFPIIPRPTSLSEAMDIDTAYKNLKRTAEQAMRLIKAFKA